MRRWLPVLAGLGVLIGAGCPATDESGGRFPYQAFVDAFGIAGDVDSTTGQTGGATTTADAVFRQPLTLRFQNYHNSAILDTTFVAWVDLSSVRDQEQEDALFRDGYIQLTEEVRLGSAFTLPPGTFVYGGSGTAGATAVTLDPATGGAPDIPTDDEEDGEDAGARTASMVEFELISPDAILVFSQPPVSCDSVAFVYRNPVSRAVLGGAATGVGGFKTYAQVDVYKCEPFRPGVFLRRIGAQGAQAANEYFEGQTIIYTFLPVPMAGTEAFCAVDIGSESAEFFIGDEEDGGDEGDGDDGGDGQ